MATVLAVGGLVTLSMSKQVLLWRPRHSPGLADLPLRGLRASWTEGSASLSEAAGHRSRRRLTESGRAALGRGRIWEICWESVRQQPGNSLAHDSLVTQAA